MSLVVSNIRFGWRGETMHKRMQAADGTLVLTPKHVVLQPQWGDIGKKGTGRRVTARFQRRLREYKKAREAYLSEREQVTSLESPLAKRLVGRRRELREMAAGLFLPQLKPRVLDSMANDFNAARHDFEKPGFLRLFALHDVFFHDLPVVQFLSDTVLRLNNRFIQRGWFKPEGGLLYPEDSGMAKVLREAVASDDPLRRRQAEATLSTGLLALRRDQFRSLCTLPEPKTIKRESYLPWPGQVAPHTDFFNPQDQSIKSIDGAAPILYLGYPKSTGVGLLPASGERVEQSIAYDFGEAFRSGLDTWRDKAPVEVYSKPWTDFSVHLTPTSRDIKRYRLGPEALCGTLFLDMRVGHAAAVDPTLDLTAETNQKAKRVLLQVRAQYRPEDLPERVQRVFGQEAFYPLQKI